MTKKEYIEALNEMVQIHTTSFKQYNIEVTNYGFSDFDDDGRIVLYVEVQIDDPSKPSVNVEIKANLYNEAGRIVSSKSECLYEEDFNGYDTISLYFGQENIAFEMVACRLFAVTF